MSTQRFTTGRGRVLWWPWLVVALSSVAAATAFLLRLQGRAWRCECGRFLLWTGDAWGPDTSQHLFDPYSLTHVLHGFIFCGVLALVVPRVSHWWRLFVAVFAEAVWEVFENSAFVIERYRAATAALGYEGDSIVNSLGDIAACGLGFALARRLGWRRSLAVFALTEVVLLVWIRDSLLLNIVMLLYPLDVIKEWQMNR